MTSDQWHRRQYDRALAVMGVNGPDWDDLDEMAKTEIRAANKAYLAEIKKHGDAG